MNLARYAIVDALDPETGPVRRQVRGLHSVHADTVYLVPVGEVDNHLAESEQWSVDAVAVVS